MNTYSYGQKLQNTKYKKFKIIVLSMFIGCYNLQFKYEYK